MKLNVLVALYCYGGNGGIASIVPEIGLWLVRLMQTVTSDPRVGEVAVERFGDVPLTMERNRAVKVAKDRGYDVLLMLDSDNIPDLYLGKRPWAQPFWDTSFDFLYERKMRGVPTVIFAPYCGPPPHPTNGGEENVYVFRAENYESQGPHGFFRFEGYDRNTAAQMRGIQEVAAGPTGCIMYSVDAFDLMPVGRPVGEVLDQYREGKLDRQRAERLIQMQSWFWYEFTDQYQTRKASTEDVTNTREIQLSGLGRFREPIVFCNWNAWAAHMKPKCVGMPEPIRMENIAATYREAVLSGISGGEELLDLKLSGSQLDPMPFTEPDLPRPEDVVVGVASDAEGLEIERHTILGHPVLAVGRSVDDVAVDALSEIVAAEARRNAHRGLQVAVFGPPDYFMAAVAAASLGPMGGEVFCIGEEELQQAHVNVAPFQTHEVLIDWARRVHEPQQFDVIIQDGEIPALWTWDDLRQDGVIVNWVEDANQFRTVRWKEGALTPKVSNAFAPAT